MPSFHQRLSRLETNIGNRPAPTSPEVRRAIAADPEITRLKTEMAAILGGGRYDSAKLATLAIGELVRLRAIVAAFVTRAKLLESTLC